MAAAAIQSAADAHAGWLATRGQSLRRVASWLRSQAQGEAYDLKRLTHEDVASVYGAACADRANGDAEALPATWRALRELRGDRASQTQTEGHDTVRPCPECGGRGERVQRAHPGADTTCTACGWSYSSLLFRTRALCAVCRRPVSQCDGRTCRFAGVAE